MSTYKVRCKYVKYVDTFVEANSQHELYEILDEQDFDPFDHDVYDEREELWDSYLLGTENDGE